MLACSNSVKQLGQALQSIEVAVDEMLVSTAVLNGLSICIENLTMALYAIEK